MINITVEDYDRFTIGLTDQIDYNYITKNG